MRVPCEVCSPNPSVEHRRDTYTVPAGFCVVCTGIRYTCSRCTRSNGLASKKMERRQWSRHVSYGTRLAKGDQCCQDIRKGADWIWKAHLKGESDAFAHFQDNSILCRDFVTISQTLEQIRGNPQIPAGFEISMGGNIASL